MKKITLILMICIYTLSSLGLGIKQFYCCGKLKSTDISFGQTSYQKCGKGDDKSDCCKTTFKSLKVKDNHVATDGITIPPKYFTDLPSYTPSVIVIALAKEPMDVANTSHAPPLHYGVSVCILHCVYRI
jgi:hypothetical protein